MLRSLHRISGMVISLFILAHLVNHLFLLNSVEKHIEVMEMLRYVYRFVVFEALLVACLMFQLISGLYFVWRRKGLRTGLPAKAQAISGLYLAFFLLNHVGAVFYGRLGLELDTNIYFGIAGLHMSLFKYFFIPYYFFAVVAIFVHIGSALYWLSGNRLNRVTRLNLFYLTMALGIVISLIFIIAFLGGFGSIAVPEEYNELYLMIIET